MSGQGCGCLVRGVGVWSGMGVWLAVGCLVSGVGVWSGGGMQTPLPEITIAAVGMYPTGMHSCLTLVLSRTQSEATGDQHQTHFIPLPYQDLFYLIRCVKFDLI